MENPVLVIGSGISGLNFALNVAEFRDVIILTKLETTRSSTHQAQGGIAAVMDKVDSFEKHVSDTMGAGSHHNIRESVEFMVNNGPQVIKRLIDFGVNFETFDGQIALTREGGHSERRIAFKGDYTGKEIEEALVSNVVQHPRIRIIEHAFASDVYLEDGEVRGLFYLLDGEVVFQASDAVVLATGGLGQLYKYTTNPQISTGDGIAMAVRAGATVKDMEFVQFHPTAFMPKEGKPFLISEAVRGEGAHLVNENGERFIDELAPRDEVAAAVYNEPGQVYLDITHGQCTDVQLRFPTITARLKEHGINICSDLIPVEPAAHYICGGIVIDEKGRTGVPGLYAFGETAYTGVHGANRLASNSLLEALVYSNGIAEDLSSPSDIETNEVEYDFDMNFEINLDSALAELRETMWENVGVVRDPAKLAKTVDWLQEKITEVSQPLGDTHDPERYLRYRNMLTTALLVTSAALDRKESLGCHIIEGKW